MKYFVGVLLSIFVIPAYAIDASDFSKLEGYSVAAVTRIEGDFEGCEYDKVLKLQNGWFLTCQTYRYHYAYSPQVAILVNDIGRGYAVKAVIGNDIYDMQAITKN